ncbi:MAG TPA: exodeoxyribonuclease VII large subunit [Flavobacteriaceae bacterium]|nr:exodeoxyribonuclease VII large subunit [Flavobacteriaceae bacterium]
MSEIIQDRKVFSLYQVTRSIQKTLNKRYSSAFWVKAELNKLNYYQHSGHCYPELVEKKKGKIITQIRSVLWKRDFIRINEAFKKTVHEPLKDGIKILFLAKINFHPQYGLSLHILNIDPGFTLGDLEKEKQETLKKLRKEGVFDNNKKLQLPLLPQRIAVISVQTSKGYADYLNVFEEAENKWGYKFFNMLFPSLLQGDNAVNSLIKQLNRIKKVSRHFDVVVIVRGGGGDIGLSCYNNYLLAKEIALFPIPVITGIGHATNETAAEMIAHKNAITPTKLAEIIIQKFHNFALPVEEGRKIIVEKAQSLLSEQKINLQTEVRHFKSGTKYLLSKNRNILREISNTMSWNFQATFKQERERLETYQIKIGAETKYLLRDNSEELNRIGYQLKRDMQQQLNKHHLSLDYQLRNLRLGTGRFTKTSEKELSNLEKNIALIHPENVLKRGYSITLYEGKSVTDIEAIDEGEELKTLLYKGEVISVVKSKSKSNEREN